MSKRKTKDVFCKRCGSYSIIPVDRELKNYCCTRRLESKRGFLCLGMFKIRLKTI